jgi:hypothetical protein
LEPAKFLGIRAFSKPNRVLEKAHYIPLIVKQSEGVCFFRLVDSGIGSGIAGRQAAVCEDLERVAAVVDITQSVEHNVPAVYDGLAARIRALRSKDQGRQTVPE